jgi:hypothetical protein
MQNQEGLISYFKQRTVIIGVLPMKILHLLLDPIDSAD